MISKLNVTAIKVLDQDEALDFYVNKLGLEKAQDFEQGPVRWLTVRVPGDTDTEIYLEKPGPPRTTKRPPRSSESSSPRAPSAGSPSRPRTVGLSTRPSSHAG
jgi:catechol 2,3-dioxygenase-like lactoylglutathione lyase family enzyme